MMKYLLTFLLYIFLQFISLSGIGQTKKTQSSFLTIDGLVYGYEFDSSRKLLKKNKQTILEGVLEDVTINVLENDALIEKIETNRKGAFKFTLKSNHLYKVEIFKEGYSKIWLMVDTKELPVDKPKQTFRFNDVEFVLNSFKTKNRSSEVIGTLFYNTNEGYVDFRANQSKSRRSGEVNNSVELMNRAVVKNKKNSKSTIAPRILDLTSNIKEKIADIFTKDEEKETKQETKSSGKIIELEFDKKNISEKYLSDKEKEILNAKQQVNEEKLRVNSREDSLRILANEARINSAELELESAKKTIVFQSFELKSQKRMLFLSIGFLVVMSGLLSIVVVYYREKRKTNIILEGKNRKILDSISYAKRIQNSILTEEKEIQQHLPESFIYFQPKDIVSGDFYWYSHIDGKEIVAAIDCTGHGVPGAFMSLIGHTLLNEIINEKRILDPAQILKHLHLGVSKVLHQSEHEARSQDGMELALCVIDRNLRQIHYAGAMNPLYLINNNNLTVISADARSIGGKSLHVEENTFEYTNHIIALEEDTSIYIFTDGYLDQFGGEKNKKFNSSRFKTLLLEMNKAPMNKQRELLQKNFDEWKGSVKQIDDVLVVGVRV